LDVVLQIHQRQLREFGGAEGIRNRSGPESAVETPRATFGGSDPYPGTFDKAAASAFDIAESQAFVDGNKRTALDVALTFLSINGYEIEGEQMELYDAMIAIAEKRMSKEQLAELFERLVS
jgi:death-on-curing protein